jgi:hypothetical protein
MHCGLRLSQAPASPTLFRTISAWPLLSMLLQVGRPLAAGALTAVSCLVPPAAPLVMDSVEVWASSRALGQSSMRHFLERAIPKGRHAAFVRCSGLRSTGCA